MFFTDQDLKLDAKNYFINKIEKKDIENNLSQLMNHNIILLNNKKTCDLKASYGDLFYDHIKDYDYFGCYDIDTLFGDINKFINPYLGEYDFISMADELFHNRLSGPFLLMKNVQEIRTLYKGEEFIKCFENPEVECFEESFINQKAHEKYKVKLILL